MKEIFFIISQTINLMVNGFVLIFNFKVKSPGIYVFIKVRFYFSCHRFAEVIMVVGALDVVFDEVDC